ncbi:MAG: YicC family protein [Balneolaceae bacterium]|nr:YicC family protein [Balneolaceae bacterium]
MTGFGRGEATENGITATVEIRSLNSRYLDINIRLPQRLQHKELSLKELIQANISRGKVNVSVHVNESETGEPDIAVDKKKVKGYAKILNDVRELANIEQPVTLSDITQFNDVFINKEDDEDTLVKKWEITKKATQKAIESLIKMRSQEGTQLKKDLIERVELIDESIQIIRSASEGRGDEVRTKLHERIEELIEDEKIDEERLELEIAILVDKMDVTEEIVRLRSHLKFFLEAIEQTEPAGRRLNFLTQEINRELNTIGSKANNSDIGQYVVKSKEALEQIREQVQNVE